MLKPYAFGAMTVFIPAWGRHREKSSRDKGLIRGRRSGYCQSDENGRNVIEGIWQRIPGRTHASPNWPYIATADVKDASDLESNRFLYDDYLTGSCGSAEPERELSRLLVELSAVGLRE